jgi:hypothetical protein
MHRRHCAPAATAVVVALAVAGGLAGCATTAASPVPPTTSTEAGIVVEKPGCLAASVLDDLGLSADSPVAGAVLGDAAVLDAVPEGFTAVGALECTVGGTMRTATGAWRAVTATSRDGAPQDVSALVAALGGGQGPAVCEDGGPVALWLVDALGRGVRLRVPLDDCDTVAASVRAALDRMTVTGVVDLPVERATAG